MIRLATPADAAEILAIYAPFIRDTSLTFEMDVPAEPDFAARIGSYLLNWPWLVTEQEGKIAGYAYASRYRERAGYQWCAECSVYMHPDFMKRGLAARLYRTLFSILRIQGYMNVYAVINLPNDASVNFHERMGFRYFATYEKVGYKLGKWKDVGWWQLQLNDYIDDPPPPVRFSELDQQQLERLGMRKDH